jgi:glycosyltransferase involved in cell wall biosynthesis
MIQAASDTSTRLQRGNQARQLIEREFDWRHIAEHIERIYSDVLA